MNTSERRQGIIDELELSSMSIRWSGLTGGNFVGGSLRHFVLNLSEQHAVNSLVERVMAALLLLCNNPIVAVTSACLAPATAVARPRRSVREHNNVMLYNNDYVDDDDEQEVGVGIWFFAWERS